MPVTRLTFAAALADDSQTTDSGRTHAGSLHGPNADLDCFLSLETSRLERSQPLAWAPAKPMGKRPRNPGAG